MISYGNRMIVNMGAVQSLYRKDESGVPHQVEEAAEAVAAIRAKYPDTEGGT